MKTVNDFIKSGAVDIAELLSLVLNKNHAELLNNASLALSAGEKKSLEVLMKQRKNGTPFAYLSGSKGFYHLDFKVTADTLIPRPETELLIDIALDLFKNKPCHLLDLGTGSGIIAVTLADKNPHWHVSATDISNNALKIAKQNAKTKINFQQSNWFESLAADQTFDFIISNPPYIAANDPYLAHLKCEPKTALIAGKDGLDAIRIIINQAPAHLHQQGFLLLEHGYNQQLEVVRLLKEKFINIKTFQDYNAISRAVLAQLK